MPRSKGKKWEVDQLKKILESLPEGRQVFAKKLIKRIEFMEETLDSLEKKITEEGPVTEGLNGNGFMIWSENPAQKSYNVMIGKYNAMVKTLIDMAPSGNEESDDLLDFLERKE